MARYIYERGQLPTTTPSLDNLPPTPTDAPNLSLTGPLRLALRDNWVRLIGDAVDAMGRGEVAAMADPTDPHYNSIEYLHNLCRERTPLLDSQAPPRLHTAVQRHLQDNPHSVHTGWFLTLHRQGVDLLSAVASDTYIGRELSYGIQGDAVQDTRHTHAAFFFRRPVSLAALQSALPPDAELEPIYSTPDNSIEYIKQQCPETPRVLRQRPFPTSLPSPVDPTGTPRRILNLLPQYARWFPPYSLTPLLGAGVTVNRYSGMWRRCGSALYRNESYTEGGSVDEWVRRFGRGCVVEVDARSVISPVTITTGGQPVLVVKNITGVGDNTIDGWRAAVQRSHIAGLRVVIFRDASSAT